MMNILLRPVAAVLCGLCLVAPAFAANHEVDIKNMKYAVSTVKVSPGDTITFVNKDGMPHSATAMDGSFDTGLLDPGQSGTVTVTEAGTIAFHCRLHASMKGKVVSK